MGAFKLGMENDSLNDFNRFMQEGLQDVYDNNLLDFDSVFDELERMYDTEV